MRFRVIQRIWRKRYKLPARAIKLIEQAGKIHGQQSRAIQIAVEVICSARN
jgi:hypothetical protein